MTVRSYGSPETFKQALEQRLRSTATSGVDFARRRQLLVFDRFLARIVAVFGNAAMLKGGLVLELRLARARTTKDVDLRVVGSADGILARLQEAGRRDLGDFMTFEILPDEEHPEIRNEGMQYEGLRKSATFAAGVLGAVPDSGDVAALGCRLGGGELAPQRGEPRGRRTQVRLERGDASLVGTDLLVEPALTVHVGERHPNRATSALRDSCAIPARVTTGPAPSRGIWSHGPRRATRPALHL